MLKILPKINNRVPTLTDLARTIVNVAKYAIAFFSSFLGFIFPSINIWIHHKLGRICNAEMVKEDRKNRIIEEAKKGEDGSLNKPYIEKVKEENAGFYR